MPDPLDRNRQTDPLPPDLGLPILDGVTASPVFAPDGALHAESGYSAATRLIYAPAQGFRVPEVSERPGPGEIAVARRLILEELLGDFPFHGDDDGRAERAHAVALLLQTFARPMIDGPTPLVLISKPTPGTGATKMVEAVGAVATGGAPNLLMEGGDEDEWRKRTTAALRTGSGLLLIDNLRRRLDSAALSAALTATVWEDRILGRSETIRLSVRCTWVATGNNPTTSNEIARRVVHIRLDARRDLPQFRTGFRHELPGWARENRARLVWACLTLIRAWIAAGRPSGGRPFGQFEAWAATMGGILEVAGIPGLLENHARFYEEADEEGNAFRHFMREWWREHGGGTVSAAELHGIAAAILPLDDARTEQAQRIRLGRMIGAMRDRTFRIKLAGDNAVDLRIRAAGTLHRATVWALERVGV